MVELPRAYRRGRRRRAPAPWLWPAVGAAYAVAVTVPLLNRWHIPPPVSQALGLAIVATLMLPFRIIMAARRSRDYGEIRLVRPWLLSCACAASAAIADVLVYASGHPPPFAGIAMWVASAALVVWTGTLQWGWETRAKLLHRVLKAGDPVAASELAQRCRVLLADRALADDQRATVALSLASALIALSARADQDDMLGEAATLLNEAVGSGPPNLAFEAAVRLVDAMRVKLGRSGDDAGYEHALEMLMEAAQRASPTVPDALGTAYAARATRFVQRAAREPDEQRADLLRSLALGMQQAAVSSTSERSSAHAVRLAALTHLYATRPQASDLDAAIKACRAAVRRLRSGDDDERALAMLELADLLEQRALRDPGGGLGGMLDRLWRGRPRHGVVERLWPDRASHDLMRALLLCMRVAAAGGEHAAEARARFPRLRALLAETSGIGVPRLFERPLGRVYSQIVAEQSGISGSRAADLAASWAAWAEARGDYQQAGEAWWCWVTALSADLRRRVLHDKEHRIAGVQGVAVQAADALVRAGRLRDAALALDLGRAVLLTERMHRDRDNLEARLVAAGELDLAARWRAAGQLIQRTDRDAFDTAGHALDAESELASAEYLALIGHERLLREIAGIAGFEDVDAPLDYDVLRKAAAEGPIVYLAAADRRGFALVVTQASQPALVELPQLDRDSMQQRAARLRGAHAGRALTAEMEALLPTLHREVVAPLVDELEPGSLVTLVPVGAVGELPIHAAGAALDEDGVWRDRTGGMVFRYAPNARVLLRAQRTAGALSLADATLLSVCVPAAAGHRLLRRALDESEGVARMFPADRATRPQPATVAGVRECLRACTVWHFACHGVHDPSSPLDSRLELADGALTLRTMFAAEAGRRRLAVLSACETAKVDDSLPDEVVGFAAAMLQAGVAGVVSCHAPVADDAATLLVLGFFARLTASDSPARALAEAQAWLRTATNAEINAAFPGVHEPPEDERPDLGRWRAYRPYGDFASWVLFSYTGA